MRQFIQFGGVGQALLRLFEGSIKALLRPALSGSVKAPLRLFFLLGAQGAYSFIQVGGVGGAEYDLLSEPVGG